MLVFGIILGLLFNQLLATLVIQQRQEVAFSSPQLFTKLANAFLH